MKLRQWIRPTFRRKPPELTFEQWLEKGPPREGMQVEVLAEGLDADQKMQTVIIELPNPTPERLVGVPDIIEKAKQMVVEQGAVKVDRWRVYWAPHR